MVAKFVFLIVALINQSKERENMFLFCNENILIEYEVDPLLLYLEWMKSIVASTLHLSLDWTQHLGDFT